MKKYIVSILSVICLFSCSNDGDNESSGNIDINGKKYKAHCKTADFAESNGYFLFQIEFPDSNGEEIIPPLSISGYFLGLDLGSLNIGDDILEHHRDSKNNRFNGMDYNAKGEWVDAKCISGQILLREKNMQNSNVKLEFVNITFTVNGTNYVVNGECDMNLRKKT